MKAENRASPTQVLIKASSIPLLWDAANPECQEFLKIWTLLQTSRFQGWLEPEAWVKLNSSPQVPAKIRKNFKRIFGEPICWIQWQRFGDIVISAQPLNNLPITNRIEVLTPQEFLRFAQPTLPSRPTHPHFLHEAIQAQTSFLPERWALTVVILCLLYELLQTQVADQKIAEQDIDLPDSHPQPKPSPHPFLESHPTIPPNHNSNPAIQDPQPTKSIGSLPNHPALRSPDEADSRNNHPWQPKIPIPSLEDQSPPAPEQDKSPSITPQPQVSPFEKTNQQQQQREIAKQETTQKQSELQQPKIGQSQVVAILASNSPDIPLDRQIANRITQQPPKTDNPTNTNPSTGSQQPEKKPDTGNENRSSVNYSSGLYTINPSGKIDVNYLFDGGGYQGELGIVSLSGLETYQPNSAEFIREIVRRILSNSASGHIIISDPKEGAQFSGTLPWESNLNSGPYLGTKTFSMQPGDQVAIVLLTNGTFENLSTTTIQNKDPRFLFSLVINDPSNSQPDKQIADVTGQGQIFALEDVLLSQQSDRDYNDLVFSVDGLLGGFTPKFDELINPGRDWRTSPIGQSITQSRNTQLLNDSNSQLTTAPPPPGSGRFFLTDNNLDTNPLGSLGNTPLDTQNINNILGFQNPPPLF